MPLIVTVGAAVSRTVSVAERKFTPAVGTLQRGAVAQVRLSSTYSPVAGTSRFALRRFPASSRSSSWWRRTGEISRSGGGTVETNAAERDTRRHVEAQADVLADRRIGPQERQVERTVRGPAPAVRAASARPRPNSTPSTRTAARDPSGPWHAHSRTSPGPGVGGGVGVGVTVGVAVGVAVGVSVGGRRRGGRFGRRRRRRRASRSASASASASPSASGVGVGVSVGVGVGVGVSVGVGVGVGVVGRLRVGVGVSVGVGVGSGVGVGVGVSVGVGVGVGGRSARGRLRRRCGGRRLGWRRRRRRRRDRVEDRSTCGSAVSCCRRRRSPRRGACAARRERSWCRRRGRPGRCRAERADREVDGAVRRRELGAPDEGRAGDRARRRAYAIARHSPTPLSVARMSRSSVPLAGSRRPPTASVGSVASCTAKRRRAQLEAGVTGVRATLRRLATEPQRHPLAAGREVATPSTSALSSTPAGRHRAVARPAPHPIQPHAGEGRHRAGRRPAPRPRSPPPGPAA